MGAVDDKRAALKAAADAGKAGLDAYRSGQEAIKTQQQAAIDLALDGAMSRGAPSAALKQLSGTIGPYGDAAQGRIAAAGDRFSASSGALGSALGTFQSGADRVEDLAYQYAKEQAQKALDARNAQDGENAHREGLSEAAYNKALAEGLGAELQAEDIRKGTIAAKSQTKEELRQIGAQALRNLTDPRERDAAMVELLTAENADEARRVLQRYAPQVLQPNVEVTPTTGFGVGNVFDTISQAISDRLSNAAYDRRGEQTIPNVSIYDRLLGEVEGLYGQGIPELYRPVREAEAHPELYNRYAYELMGGDPYLAAGIFPDDPGVANAIDNQADRDLFVRTGMTPSQYDDYTRERDASEYAALDADNARISQEAMLADGLIGDTATSFGLDEDELYAAVDGLSEVIASALSQARQRLNEGELATDLASSLQSEFMKNLPDDEDFRPYRDAILAMALEQFKTIAAPYENTRGF